MYIIPFNKIATSGCVEFAVLETIALSKYNLNKKRLYTIPPSVFLVDEYNIKGLDGNRRVLDLKFGDVKITLWDNLEHEFPTPVAPNFAKLVHIQNTRLVFYVSLSGILYAWGKEEKALEAFMSQGILWGVP